MTALTAIQMPAAWTALASAPVAMLAALLAGVLVVSLFALAHALPTLAPRWTLRALGARPLGRLEGTLVRATAERLARAENLPEPAILVVPHPQVNLFVLTDESGRPVIALTEGAVRALGPAETEAAVGAALARAADPRLRRATVAAGVGLAASQVAGLGAISGAEAEGHPFTWPLGTPFVLLGAALSRGLAGPPPGGAADLRGARISGRQEESARLLEHMEFTAHAEPMSISAALSRLALVDPRGEPTPLSLASTFPTPSPCGPRAALLRGTPVTPDGPSCAQAA